MNKRGALALSQIFILMIGIFAVSYAVGSQVGLVSGFEQIKLNVAEEGAQAGFTYWLIDETTIQKRNSAGGIDGLYKYGTWTSQNIDGWIFHNPDGDLASNYVHVDDHLAIAAKNALEAQPTPESPLEEKTTPELGGTPNPAYSPKASLILNYHGMKYSRGENKFGKYLIGEEGGLYRQNEDGSWYSDDNNNGEKDGEESTLPIAEGLGAFFADKLGKKAAAEVATKLTAKQALSAILKNAGIAIAIYGSVKGIAALLAPGADPILVEATARALGGGYFIGTTFYTLLGPKGAIIVGVLGPWAAAGIGILAGAAIFWGSYKKETQETITFMCQAWQAQTGGEYCETCNTNNPLDYCTEYQCRSLGQGCELVNKGTTEQKCVWINKGDITPPRIEALSDVLSNGYNYVPETSISPPDRGVRIEYEDSEDKCSPAFTPFTFGVSLDKPGSCKIDSVRKASFDNMRLPFGGSSLFKYNHTQFMMFPGSTHLEQEGFEVHNGGNYEFYVKCMSANGYANIADFVFKFCIDDGPDNTAPNIYGTNWINGAPISFFEEGETHELDIELYVNEPAECKFSRSDKEYGEMENEMTCTSESTNINALLGYTCSSTLTGLENRKDNKFYFRCKDQPALEGTDKENERNVNTESFEFILVGTQPLVITDVEPNETTIKGGADSIKVTLE
ncbi:MAG: hypothetical protein KJI69_06185, partial [Patescibacteria group bacterium]|nr:hypothetical protein [Patescibacteria group bacterium]